ncbi:MAG: helix-turn-helix transcriptional regulator [Bacteroidales bacterium]|nr:helix-turn-helix transcriptional regulator [Candidatus Scybalousia scybalohippi]
MYERYSKIRDSKGLNDSKVSKGTGVAKATLSDWKNGKTQPKLNKLQAIADFLGVKLTDITSPNEISYDSTTHTWEVETTYIDEVLKDNELTKRLEEYAKKLIELKKMEDI